MGVGLRIKIALREKKMTIKELSALSGVSLNTLYSITKRDSENIDNVILGLISSSLGLSWSFFMGCAPFEDLELLRNHKDEILIHLEDADLFHRKERSLSDVGIFEFWQLLSSTVMDIIISDSGEIQINYDFSSEYVQRGCSDAIEKSLLHVFNRLEYGGKRLVIEYAELLASNPAFLLTNSQGTHSETAAIKEDDC